MRTGLSNASLRIFDNRGMRVNYYQLIPIDLWMNGDSYMFFNPTSHAFPTQD